MAIMDAPGGDGVRRTFLAGRDVACPRCGYNLRDGRGEACPECGLLLVLELAGRRAWSAPAVFAFLAFGWALTAGVLNTTRNVRALYQMAMGPVLVFGSGERVTGNPVTLGGQTSVTITRGPVGFSWSALWSLPASEWIDPAWSVACAALAASGLVLVCRALRSPAPSWRAARLVGVALYGVYGGYHLVSFVRQTLDW